MKYIINNTLVIKDPLVKVLSMLIKVLWCVSLQFVFKCYKFRVGAELIFARRWR